MIQSLLQMLVTIGYLVALLSMPSYSSKKEFASTKGFLLGLVLKKNLFIMSEKKELLVKLNGITGNFLNFLLME
jgi:hypothetical protein